MREEVRKHTHSRQTESQEKEVTFQGWEDSALEARREPEHPTC